MKKLEVTFSEEDVSEALQAYLNRFFLPHRQVKVESFRISAQRTVAVTVIPSPDTSSTP